MSLNLDWLVKHPEDTEGLVRSFEGGKPRNHWLGSYPAEVESQPGSHSPTHRAQLPTVHSQPVLVGGSAVEVVFELGGKGHFGLITVQASPLLITAACGKKEKRSQRQRKSRAFPWPRSQLS